MTAIVEFDPLGAEAIKGALGPDASVLPSLDALKPHLELNPFEDCIVLGPSVDQQSTCSPSPRSCASPRPSLGVVMVRRRIDTAVLSDALRAGVREVVQERDLAGLAAAVRRQRDIAARAARADRARRAGTPDARRTAGSSRCSRPRAAAARRRWPRTSPRRSPTSGKGSVALLDLDLAFGDVAIALQLFPTHTIADAVPIGDDLDGPALRGAAHHRTAPACRRSSRRWSRAPPRPSTSPLVTRILDLLREEFDYVIVDTPPALDDNVLAAFDRSDVVALIATLDIPALKNLKLTLETLDLISYPRDRLKIVLNRADSKVGPGALRGREDASRRRSSPRSPRAATSRPRPTAASRSSTDDPKHPVSIAITARSSTSTSSRPATTRIPAQMRTDRRFAPVEEVAVSLVRPPGPGPAQRTGTPTAAESATQRRRRRRRAEPAATTRSADLKRAVHASLLESLGPAALRLAPHRGRARGARCAPRCRRCSRRRTRR